MEGSHEGYRRAKRQSLTAAPLTLPIAVGLSAPGGARISFGLLSNQAIHLISIDGNISEGTDSGSISVSNAQIVVSGSSNVGGQFTFARNYPSRVTAGVILSSGQSIHVSDPYWLFALDYAEQGRNSLLPAINIDLQAEFNNAAAAAVDVLVQLTAIIELWEKTL